MRRRGLHRISHRRNVRVEAHAGILNIEHQRIETREHGVRGPLGFSVQAVNGQARRFIRGGRNTRIEIAAEPVLRAEQCHQLHARRVRQQINRAAAIAVDPSLIGN